MDHESWGTCSTAVLQPQPNLSPNLQCLENTIIFFPTSRFFLRSPADGVARTFFATNFQPPYAAALERKRWNVSPVSRTHASRVALWPRDALPTELPRRGRVKKMIRPIKKFGLFKWIVFFITQQTSKTDKFIMTFLITSTTQTTRSIFTSSLTEDDKWIEEIGLTRKFGTFSAPIRKNPFRTIPIGNRQQLIRFSSQLHRRFQSHESKRKLILLKKSFFCFFEEKKFLKISAMRSKNVSGPAFFVFRSNETSPKLSAVSS